MQKTLMAKGVPQSVIYCGYAGFTHTDSVVRDKEVFGKTKLTIISQAFQHQRAISGQKLWY
ncbi:SanA protein [Enterobacteriaceae bacterium bta3-1]|nr:SanA protein [Enterobacteriaceae bacterium bta3-1]